MERRADGLDRAGDGGKERLAGARRPQYEGTKVVEAVAARLSGLRQSLPVQLLVLYESRGGGDRMASSDYLMLVYGGPRRDEAHDLVRRALEMTGLESRVYSQGEFAQSRGALDSVVAKGMVLYQEGVGGRRPAWKRALSWLGDGLLCVGVLLLLAIGTYHAYSYYSLSQMEQGAAAGPAVALASDKPLSAKEGLWAPGSLAPPAPEGAASMSDAAGSGGARGDPSPALVPANRILISSIQLDSPIVETGLVFEEGEWRWERPKQAVGHLQGTANPGGPGNIVMAGHISSPSRGEGQVFKRLPEVQLGDLVVLYTPLRTFQYRVVAKKVVLPSEVGVLAPTPDETLTLITCVPDLIYSHRLIVTAKRVAAP